MANNLTVFGALAGGVQKRAGVMQGVDNRGGWTPWIREPYSGAWQRNDEWCVDSVLAYPTVYACITLIANDIAKLRFKLMDEAAGIWTEVNSAAFSPFLRKPNRFQNHIQFRQWWVMSKLTRGNAYVLKQRDNRGVVVAGYVLDPQRCLPLVSPDGEVFYQIGEDNLNGFIENSVTVPASEIMHDRMNCLFHPLVGISPLFAAGLAANIGLKIQGNSAHFFGNGSSPGGVLTAPGSISDETAARMKAHWDANYTGKNAGKVAVLGDGLQFEALRMTATDSQLIESLRWTDQAICSAFHVPAYKVGVGVTPGISNVEAMAQDYYSTCLQILIEEMEACIDEGLGLDGYSRGVELDLDGLLRMDKATKVTTLAAAVGGAIMTPNEARLSLNLGKLVGGDTVYMQQQDNAIEAIYKRDQAIISGDLAPDGSVIAPPAPEAPAEPPEPTPTPDEQARAFLERITKGLTNA